MRSLSIIALVLAGLGTLGDSARAAPLDGCKQCSDHHRRCMKNYPGATCKIDYDICMKSCRKK